MIGLLSLLWGGALKVIGGLFTFFTTKPGIYVGLILIGLGALWYANHRGYNSGVAYQKSLEAAMLAAAQKVAASDQKKRDDISKAIELKWAHDHPQIVTITNTITKEIPAHVPPQVDHQYPVPCGLVRLWDASVLSTDPGNLPYPTGLSDDSTCPVTASVLAQAGVTAIGQYKIVSAQLIALQDWVRAEQNLKLGMTQPVELYLDAVQPPRQLSDLSAVIYQHKHDPAQMVAFIDHDADNSNW